MFNIGAGEAIVILVVALLVLGPQRLPEMARALGKFMREFRRQTDEVRTMVEREFYRMDIDLLENQPQGPSKLAAGALPTGASASATAGEPISAATAPVAPPPASTEASAPDAQSVAAAANAVDPATVAQSPAPEVVPASPIQNEVFRAIPRGPAFGAASGAAQSGAQVASAPQAEPKTELVPELGLPAADSQLKN